MTTRLIAYKYREGKVKRTLKRELTVLEIVKGEANVAVVFVVGISAYECSKNTARVTSFVATSVHNQAHLTADDSMNFMLVRKKRQMLRGFGRRGTAAQSQAGVLRMVTFEKLTFF